MKIRINTYLPKTSVEGPGIRFCIWVQGCSIRCKGCANAHMWDKFGGTEYDVSDFLNLIFSYSDVIEGITFLGGEPLEQVESVAEIAKSVRQKGLSVLVFTGYKYEDIKDKPECVKLLKNTDILIDGKYEEALKDLSRPWVGSSNQNYYFLTDRYDKNIINEYKNRFELHFDKTNKVVANGMGDYEKLAKIIK